MTWLWILIILLVVIFLLDRLVERMYRYERKSTRLTPQKYDIPFEEIQIPAMDGAHLHGWWIPVSPQASTLILIHGWGRNLSRVLPYIRGLHPLGYNLLAFDARSHGDSSSIPHPTMGTFSEDAISALDFLFQSELIVSHEIGILGLSVGGSAAINAAGWDKRVKCAVTIGAPSHPVEVMKLEFEKRKIPVFIASFLLGYLRLRFGIDFDKIAPLNNLPKTEADVFLIHGENDETIPLSQGQALAKAGNPQKVRLWIVPGKGHSDCDTHPQFWEKLEAFLKATFPVPT